MNREIKFRVWDENAGKMVYPIHFQIDRSQSLIEWDWNGKMFVSGCGLYASIVMWYTGFDDINGEFIYDGDILWDNVNKQKRKFKWNSKAGIYSLQYDKGEPLCDDNIKFLKLRVVGNIFENTKK